MSTLKVNKIENTGTTDGGIEIDSDGHVQVDGVQLPSAGALSNRNLIINGAMQVAQRYGYHSPQTDWNNYDASDRIFKRTSGSATSSVQTRNDDAPSGFIYSDKLTITSQDSDTYIGRGTCLEWNDISHLRAGYSDAKTITLSFWVKASISGTYCFAYTSYVAAHSDHDAATSYVTEYTVDSADTWEYKTITVTLPTSTPSNWDGSNGGNTTGLRLQWSVSRAATANTYETATTDSWISGNSYCTSNQTNMGATNGSTFQITGVQLEVGSAATPFEHRSYGDELARCQRYYYKSSAEYRQHGYSYGTNSSTDGMCVPYPWPVTMRANPTASLSGGSDGGSNATISFINDAATHGMINLISTSSDNAVWWNGATITADAEL